MLIYAVDLGTTNLKAVLYDEQLNRLATAAAPMVYARRDAQVEFDPRAVLDTVLDLIRRCARAGEASASEQAVIALTGQAESLVLTDAVGEAVRPAMSWLDARATAQADQLADVFDTDEAFAVTGQPAPAAIWPAAKLRWLRDHEPETLRRTTSVSMIKDDLVRRLTGIAVGEVTTRGFTYLWDVRGGHPWDRMLEHCGIAAEMLAEVAPAGADVGAVTDGIAESLPPAAGYRVNVGALDHFSAMAGTGSYRDGLVSESAGTVLSLSALQRDWTSDAGRRVSFHAGLNAGDTVVFNAADTGGLALEWYRALALEGMPYAELESALSARTYPDAPLFLPYLTGISPPDFLATAKGAFLDIDLAHDRIDLAFAVQEGIAHLLLRNLDYLGGGGIPELVSTGGGAASSFLNQLKADVCGVDVLVPDELEATCRGAAVLALRAAGRLDSLEDAAELNPPAATRFRPRPETARGHRDRYHRFDDAIRRLYHPDR